MTTSHIPDLGKYFERVERATPVSVKGRVKELVGLLVKATVPEAWLGELCLIYSPRSSQPVKAEVVGFQGGGCAPNAR
jgi:flagellar biosynthesis/type III secretory pathway ATPase